MPENKYDFIFMNGVHSIFEEFEPLIDNIIKLFNETGCIAIFGIFNPANIDVIIKSKIAGTSNWEKGWNLFSIKTISNYLENSYPNYSFEFVPWNIDIEIPKNLEDEYRSYTIDISENKKMIINGLQLVHNFYLLKAVKKQILKSSLATFS